MDSLAISGYGEIRTTEDFRYSVFDTIEVLGDKKNPRDAWEALCEKYPEVVDKTDNFQFSGKGQRLTPVADENNILYIIGLLPGAVGKSYREEAATLMIAKMKSRRQQPETKSLILPEQRANSVFDFAIKVFSYGTNLSKELQSIHALRAVEAQIPECAQMVKALVGVVQETVATSDRHLTPSELGEIYQEQHSLPKPIRASDINIALLDAGLQSKEVVIKIDKQTGKEKKINRWHLTDSGKQWGVVVQDKARGHEKTVEHVRWLPTVLEVISL